MEKRSREMDAWVATVIERAGHSLTRVDVSSEMGVADFYAYDHSPFWGEIPLPPQEDAHNYLIRAQINFSQFTRVATIIEKNKFLEAQISALLSMDDEIISISEYPIVKLKDISRDRCIESKEVLKSREKYPDVLFDYIHKKREFFSKNSMLDFITNLSNFAWQAAKEQNFVDDIRNLSQYLSGLFYERLGLDINPGKIVPMLRKLDDHDSLRYFLADKKDDAKKVRKPLIGVKPIDPNKIREPNNIAEGVSDIFSASAVSPRHAKIYTGGRAGWGPQKPDLWKPENK